MQTIPARSVRPGQRIRTAAGVTLTVSSGNWTDADYAEPADPQNPTHVLLGEDGPEGVEVLLPVGEAVQVLPDEDSRDGLCDDCVHAPGEHPVAVSVTYCESKYEHEHRVITDGSVAYVGASRIEEDAVLLGAHPTATETPRNGIILRAICAERLPGSGDPCEAEVRWEVTEGEWNDAAVTPEDRANLTRSGEPIQDQG